MRLAETGLAAARSMAKQISASALVTLFGGVFCMRSRQCREPSPGAPGRPLGRVLALSAAGSSGTSARIAFMAGSGEAGGELAAGRGAQLHFGLAGHTLIAQSRP